MSNFSCLKLNTSFEFLPESQEQLDWGEVDSEKKLEFDEISEVSSGVTSSESSEFSTILVEVKALRLENEELSSSMEEIKRDNADIKETLTHILRLQKLSMAFNDTQKGEKLQNDIKILQSDNATLKMELDNAKKEVEHLKKVMKPKPSKPQYENPIEVTINGEWKIVESKNVDEFLKAQTDFYPLEAVSIRYSNPCFEVKKKRVRTCVWSNGTKNHQLHYFAFSNGDRVRFSVTDNKLISTQTRLTEDDKEEEFSRIERFVEGEKLKVIWERNGVSCERIYEKLDNWSSRNDPFSYYYD